MGFPDTEEKIVEGLTRSSNPIRTLCEVLRELWDESLKVIDESLRHEMQSKLKEAYLMGKKMDRKLRQYKHDWWVDLYKNNHNHDKHKTMRQNR